MGYAVLSLVRSGWTGTAVLTYSGITTTITPRTRESVASIVVRLAAEVYVDSGLSLTIASLDDTSLSLTAASAFSLTLTGTIESRSGLINGPYSAVTQANGDPTDVDRAALTGVRAEAPTLLVPTGQPTGSGGYGHAHAPQLGRTRLRWWTTADQVWGDETASGVYDLWQDGRIFGRYRIDGWRRVPMGKRRDTAIELVADVQAVTE